FFQAEDGIRDLIVTGVQTCALPICLPRWTHSLPPLHSRRPRLRTDVCRNDGGRWRRESAPPLAARQRQQNGVRHLQQAKLLRCEIGRASCRERGKDTEVEG